MCVCVCAPIRTCTCIHAGQCFKEQWSENSENYKSHIQEQFLFKCFCGILWSPAAFDSCFLLFLVPREPSSSPVSSPVFAGFAGLPRASTGRTPREPAARGAWVSRRTGRSGRAGRAAQRLAEMVMKTRIEDEDENSNIGVNLQH